MYIKIAESKLLAYLERPEQRKQMFSSWLSLKLAATSSRVLNMVVFFNASPIQKDEIFRDQPRDIFILNQTQIYEEAYWTEYRKVISEFYDRTFVVLFTILTLLLLSNEFRWRAKIEYSEVWNRFNILMQLRRITTSSDNRVAFVMIMLSLWGCFYLVFLYAGTVYRYMCGANHCTMVGLTAITDLYARVLGVQDFYNAIRSYHWDLAYSPTVDGEPTYRRTHPVRWHGIYIPHFSPEFRKHLLTDANYTYRQWRDIYIHALQISGGIVRLTEADRVRALVYIKGVLEGCISRNESKELVKIGKEILKQGQIDEIDRFAGHLLKSYYEPMLKNKFFEEVAKIRRHSPDHYVYNAPVIEDSFYDEENDSTRYIAKSGPYAEHWLPCSWSEHPSTWPRFITEREMQTKYGMRWAGVCDRFNNCTCRHHTTEYVLYRPTMIPGIDPETKEKVFYDPYGELITDPFLEPLTTENWVEPAVRRRLIADAARETPGGHKEVQLIRRL